MGEEPKGWWRQHGLTVVILLTAFSLAILVRSLWAYSIFQQWGWLYVYGGGSDSFYHSRVMVYIIQNHTNLIRDYGLHYPVGEINPREPLFDWMNAVLGILFQGFFAPAGGQSAAVVAGAYFLDIQSPLWAALGVFPVYLIGREVSSRRMGLVAAMIYPFMVSSIESSALGYANYLTFYTFVMLLTVYAYIRMVKSIGHRRWVASYRRPREIPAALVACFRYERTGLKWAVFTGVCLGALALSWQGYPFFIAALVIFLIVQMLAERIRRVDSFALYSATWIVGLIGFPMAMPYYIVQGLFAGWFDTPLIVFFGTLVALLPFLLLRDQPWVVSVPAFLLTGLAAVGLLLAVDPSAFVTIITGQGYFVKTLVYSTVAEAQAPSIDSLILGFGVVTFFMAFVGLLLFAFRIGREKFRREHVLFFVFAVITIYLPITAAKFFLLSTATFALLPAEVILLILEIAGYAQLRRTAASLSDRRGQLTSIRRSFKPRHVLVMALVLVIIVPNVWYAIDAGIPYGNLKSQYNDQIFETIPPPLRTSPGNASSFYLGAAGTSLDTPNQYDEAGYNWLAQQDTNLPLYQRPALVSWWDYGFQTLGEGGHPVVADNFQDGIDPSGAFLLSQNESEAIGVLAVELLAGEQVVTHQPYLPASLNALLAADGVALPELHNLLANTSADVPLVIANPGRYLPVNAAHLDPTNAMYMAASWFLADTLSLNQIAKLYNDIQAYTGWSIRYAMVDSRLIPFSGSNTGIFYAPADLTDRAIDSGGNPSAFFNVSVVGSDGNTYPEGHVPANVQAVSYNINYFAPFYNSMIYRTYFGYNGSDTGQGSGIPGLSGSLQGSSPEPGWMLQHFQVVYRTAYYCPYANPNAHPGCFVAANLPTAVSKAKATNGTADTSAGSYFNGGEAILEYYPGQTLTGTVEMPNGAPVPGAFVTVDDGWGIPHMVVPTAADGSYRVVLPPGNDTVNVTTGSIDGLTQQGTTVLATLHLRVSSAYALSDNAPTEVQNILLRPATVQGEVYWNTANNSSYSPSVDTVVPGAEVNLWGPGLASYHLASDASGAFRIPDIAPGVYNFSVTYGATNYTQSNLYLTPGLDSNQSVGLSPGEIFGTVNLPTGASTAGATVRVSYPTGSVSTAVNASGAFRVSDLGPGSYTVQARLPSASLASVPTVVSLATKGASAHLNLTLTAVGSILLPVARNGAPVAGFPVRFTPASSALARSSTNSSAPVTNTTGANSTLFVSPANGTIVATLPLGSYRVYAAGLLNGRPYAAIDRVTISAAGTLAVAPAANLVPAYLVSGHTPPPTSTVSPTEISISAFASNGYSVSAFDNESGNWLLLLPAGTYGLSASVPPTSGAPAYVGLASLSVASDTSVSLGLGPATTFHATVGAVLGRGSIYPAPESVVRLTVDPTGAYLTATTNRTGNFTLLIPGTLPVGESLCLTVTAPGFAPFDQCGLSPQTAASLGILPLNLTPVPTRIVVTGLPAGTATHLNLTAVGSPAASSEATGGTGYALSLTPGNYSVAAWAPIPHAVGLYRTIAPVLLDIPIGSGAANLTVPVRFEIPATGKLALPKGVSDAAVEVSLSGDGFEQNLTGSAFVLPFLTPPGTDTLLAQAALGNASFSNLTRIVVNATGAMRPALVSLLQPGGLLRGTVSLPDGSPLNGTRELALETGSGLALSVPLLGGVFSLALPLGTVVHPFLNTTLFSPGPGGFSEEGTYRTASGATCTVASAQSNCTVVLLATKDLLEVTGTVVYPSYPGPLSGTVMFVGPSPSVAAQEVPVVSGSFAAFLLPGAYEVYATATEGGVTLASMGRAVLSTYPTETLPLTVGTTWTDFLTLSSAAARSSATANLTLSGPSGMHLVETGVPVGVPIPLALPPGSWTFQANASANPYGVRTATTGTAVVELENGNAATGIALTPLLSRTVDFQIQGPHAFTVLPGGTVSLAYSLTNVGNTPLALHLVGAPSTWTFNFTPENVSLGLAAGNRSATGSLRIHLPAATPTTVPPITLEAVLAGGIIVGVATPAPTLSVEPYYGIEMGASPSLGTVGSNSTTLPFWVLDTGNAPESVSLSISNLVAIEGLGWTARILSGTTPVIGPVTLQPATNTSYRILLATGPSNPSNPGVVHVEAAVVNRSAAVTSTLALSVSLLPVSISNSTLTVTGPGLGTPPAYPTWLLYPLVFVPAAAALLFFVTLRWYRTRRWRR